MAQKASGVGLTFFHMSQLVDQERTRSSEFFGSLKSIESCADFVAVTYGIMEICNFRDSLFTKDDVMVPLHLQFCVLYKPVTVV